MNLPCLTRVPPLHSWSNYRPRRLRNYSPFVTRLGYRIMESAALHAFLRLDEGRLFQTNDAKRHPAHVGSPCVV